LSGFIVSSSKLTSEPRRVKTPFHKTGQDIGARSNGSAG
jgi:hypothetical protein